MKSCEEMAQSVICRASAHRIARKRRMATLAVAVFGVCVMGLGAAVVNWPEEPPAPTLQVQAKDPTTGTTLQPQLKDPTTETSGDKFLVPDETVRVRFLTFNAASGDIVPLQNGVRLPNQMEMRVQDLRGLTDKEAEAVIEAEKKYANGVIASYTHEQGFSWTQYSSKNAVLTTILGGHFILSVEDLSSIEHIHFATSGTGQLINLPGRDTPEDTVEYVDGKLVEYMGPNEYELDETNIGSYYFSPYGGIGFSWMPDGRDVRVIFEDPTVPLSVFNDRITVTVSFKDGSVETHVIDLLISEHGQMSAVYRGLETEA